MERGRLHGRTSVGYRIKGAKSDKKPDMRSKRDQGQLQWTLIFLVALTMQPQAVCAVGMFELQIRHFQNPHGLLQSGECCDLQPSGGQRCSLRDQCDTFFQACLKEYQARVVPTGACTFGSGSTGILGGNSQTLHPRGHDGGGDGGGGGGGGEGDRSNGHIVIPFRYAWPKSFSLVLEALDFDNDTAKSGQLIDRVLLSSMLNPGDQWQTRRHHSYTLSLEYRLRFRCDTNYFGPHCNKFCRARHDFFGHFGCDPSGTKVCTEGWTGAECSNAVCRQGCHQIHGSCSLPGECECNYGWQGALCDQCVTFPGCVYGSCTEPWQCVCDVNWGGLLCDKDLNYCGTHQPCKNGGTCSNTEPNEYQCECQDGFGGRNCDIVERACVSSPCKNGATCVEDSADFRCICSSGWTGHVCANVVRQCDLRPCGRGATCQETKEGHRCLCPPGWSGRTCQLDADECEMGVCMHARSCRNLIGGYLCDCLPGWTGSNCDIKNSSCQGLCLNGGHCEDLVSGSRCLCLPEFSGKYCQTVSSLCDSDPCLNGGQCVAGSEGKATCSCPMGYSGLFCEVVLDPCNPNPCQQGMVCHGTEGRYMCACPEGYYGTECLSRKDSCVGHNCQGAMTDSARMSFYMVLVAVSALLTVCACAACAFVLSHVHRQRRKHRAAPQDEGINNQREFATLIRNVERPAAPPVSANALGPVSHCHEEIELTLPPAPANASPALKPARAPKLDISNLEREKLNRFHYVENQELEA